jgi:hypothetical protein
VLQASSVPVLAKHWPGLAQCFTTCMLPDDVVPRLFLLAAQVPELLFGPQLPPGQQEVAEPAGSSSSSSPAAHGQGLPHPGISSSLKGTALADALRLTCFKQAEGSTAPADESAGTTGGFWSFGRRKDATKALSPWRQKTAEFLQWASQQPKDGRRTFQPAQVSVRQRSHCWQLHPGLLMQLHHYYSIARLASHTWSVLCTLLGLNGSTQVKRTCYGSGLCFVHPASQQQPCSLPLQRVTTALFTDLMDYLSSAEEAASLKLEGLCSALSQLARGCSSWSDGRYAAAYLFTVTRTCMPWYLQCRS